MAKAFKQVVIDFEAGEIKGSTQSIRDDIERVLIKNNVRLAGYNLGSFKVVTGLTRNSDRLKDRLNPVHYKTKKEDITDYLDLIKESDPVNYEKFTKMLKTTDFIVVSREFNKELAQTEEEKAILLEIMEKNQKLREAKAVEKAETKKLREEDRAKRKAIRDEKKAKEKAKKDAEKN